MTTSSGWLRGFRELAELTLGIEPDDPRLWSIMQAMNEADAAYRRSDWGAFEDAAAKVRRHVTEPEN